MDELDKNLPDDFWRKTFEEASETPPQRVWAAIEQRLDESDSPKILPLWGTGLASSRPLLWGAGMAAAVALLLVGWWTTTGNPDKQLVAQAEKAGKTQAVVATRSAGRSAITQLPSSAARTTIEPGDVVASVTSSQRKGIQLVRPSSELAAHLQNVQKIAGTSKAFHRFDPMDSQIALSQLPLAQAAASSRSTASFASNHSTNDMASFTMTGDGLARTNKSNQRVAFSLLAGKPFRMRQPIAIQRIVWVRPAELPLQPEDVKSKHQPREMWASVSMMPGSFNPSVALRSAQPALANTVTSLAGKSNQVSVNSRANFSVAYQAGAGVQLSERWSVESGIGYLSGRSTVEAPGHSSSVSASMDFLTNRNSATTNAYVDALRNSIQSKGLANNSPQYSYNNIAVSNSPASAYDGQTLQAISNNFQFVQVPVQVGYQLRPRKKLSMAVLGGLLANIFVRNTVGDALVVTGKDGVYRPVALAATMGARLRYRPTRQWSASVAGVYQPSLESGTQADAQVQSHPTSMGMSFGLDYHF